MHPLGLTGGYRLFAGLILGIIFGIILVKSEIVWRKTLFEQFELKKNDFLKIFFYSLAIWLILFWFLNKIGIVEFNFRPGYFWATVVGAIFTGVGLSICGHIPATAVAVLGTGRAYAIWVVIGMGLAISLVHVVSDWLSGTIYGWSVWIKFYDRLDGYITNFNMFFCLAIFSVIMALLLEYGPISSSKEE